MTQWHYAYLLLPAISSAAFANGENALQNSTQLDEITVSSGNNLAGSEADSLSQTSDKVISQAVLKNRSATLGNALAAELSVHSNPFGGGASAPIIRGQEGFRIKILQNGADVVDMSAVSPDHAVAADSLLAKQIELLRGAATLRYATASPAGVVNVVDQRIPTAIPEKGFEGELNLRADTASKEQAVVSGLTFSPHRHFALRLEGLSRRSDNYRVPAINLGQKLNFVPDTHHRSTVGTIGLSFIGESGYLGAAYSQRDDKYGLPGHNHKFDNCAAHITDPKGSSLYETRVIPRNYLIPYPHLMDDSDVIDSPHFHCSDDHAQDHAHSHDNPFGYVHNHNHPGPWIELHSKRWDLRGEWRNPLAAIEKVKLAAAYVDYYHDEKDLSEKFGNTQNAAIGMPIDGKAAAYFKSRGTNVRLEINHAPFGNFTGSLGVQYQRQRSQAHIPSERVQGEKYPLVPHTNQQLSFFATEQYRWQDLLFEVGFRTEKQRTPVDYRAEKLAPYIKKALSPLKQTLEQPDLSTYQQRANSYAASINWFFDDLHQLSLIYSHNERIPTPMELYYYGKHLATSSFMFGNKNLKKEQSNNLEIGLARTSGQFDYKINLYHHRFQNYIHNENLWKEGNLFMRRFTQSKAKFYGLEGEISYAFTPNHKATLFGDWITGKVSGLPKIYGDKIYREYACLDEEGLEQTCNEVVGREVIERPDRRPARLPPARLGLRWQSQITENWAALLEYSHVFSQKKVAVSVSSKRQSKHSYEPTEAQPNPPLQPVYVRENATKGYHLLNIGIDYRKQWQGIDYKLALNANNLLNEKVYLHTSYLPFVPQIGRNFMLGLEVKF